MERSERVISECSFGSLCFVSGLALLLCLGLLALFW